MAQYVSARRSFNGLTRVDMEEYFDDMEIENLYQWIDRIPLTRPKKNLAKDFSDGVLVAEMIKHYFPRMVDLHNYTPAHSSKQKMENWYLLNRAYSTVRQTLPMITPPVDSVAKSLLEEKELEGLAKDETIRILNAKLKRLEHLLHLKDLRIEDLETRLNASTGIRLIPYEDV